jgi:transcriptional regulator with XRE-family HTH domain
MTYVIDKSIARIRAFCTAQGWTKTKLAHAADLNDTTLRHFNRSNWNPTTHTIRKLEGIIPDQFVCDMAPPKSPHLTLDPSIYKGEL